MVPSTSHNIRPLSVLYNSTKIWICDREKIGYDDMLQLPPCKIWSRFPRKRHARTVFGWPVRRKPDWPPEELKKVKARNRKRMSCLSQETVVMLFLFLFALCMWGDSQVFNFTEGSNMNCSRYGTLQRLVAGFNMLSGVSSIQILGHSDICFTKTSRLQMSGNSSWNKCNLICNITYFWLSWLSRYSEFSRWMFILSRSRFRGRLQWSPHFKLMRPAIACRYEHTGSIGQLLWGRNIWFL